MPIDVTIAREQSVTVDAIAVSESAVVVSSDLPDIDVVIVCPDGTATTIAGPPAIDVIATQPETIDAVVGVLAPVIDVIAINNPTVVSRDRKSPALLCVETVLSVDATINEGERCIGVDLVVEAELTILGGLELL